MEARGTGSWVVDRVSVDRVGSKSGSGHNPGRPLTESGQKSWSGLNRVRDDVIMTSASDNLNRFDRVENGLGKNRFDRVGHVTGSS